MRIRYESPLLMVYGPLRDLTARVGDQSEADTFYSAKGIVTDVGSIDSCEVDQFGNVISDPACPYTF